MTASETVSAVAALDQDRIGIGAGSLLGATPTIIEPSPHARSGRLPFLTKVGWGAGALVIGVLTFAKVLLLTFLVDGMGVNAAFAGLLIAASKVYDVIADPAVGSLSDRTRSRWGRRRPYLALGGLLTWAAFVMLFSPPSGGFGSLLTLYILAALILYSTAFGVFSVAHYAMPAEMTDDYHERTALASYRAVFESLGLTAGAYVAPTIVTHFGGGRAGYSAMAWIMGGSLFAVALICVVSTSQRGEPDVDSPPRISLVQKLRLIKGNVPFMVLMASSMAMLMTNNVMNAASLFFVHQVLHAGDAWLGNFFVVLNVTLFASLPLWLYLSKRMGKRNAYLIGASVLGAACLSWLAATPQEPYWRLLIRMSLIGVGSGAVLVLQRAMLPDTMAYQRRLTGLRQEGVFSGIYVSLEKIATAFSMWIVGSLLTATGYVPGVGRIAEPTSAIRGIYIAFAILPAGFVFLSAIVLFYYRLDEASLSQAVESENGGLIVEARLRHEGTPR